METNNSKPKVSIIIPVYNGSNFLKEAIDSALGQTYKNIEVIIINDGSNDNGATEKIAKSYGNKIRYYKKVNGGVATALNFGIKKMSGEYFSWLSHDDLYEKTKIEDQIRLMLSLHTNNNIVVCNDRVLFENGIKKEALIDKRTFGLFDIFLATGANVGINGCALLIPKKALVESGGFDPTLPVTQDYDLWYRLSSQYNYRFVLLEKNLVTYRIHDKQDSIQKQKLCLKAGDDFRSNILINMEYDRFKGYLMHDKENLKYAWSNYNLYRSRGYIKTASLMLWLILRYYHEYDSVRFYKTYYSELETDVTAEDIRKRARPFKISTNEKELTDIERLKIDEKYAELSDSRSPELIIKVPSQTDKDMPPKSLVGRATWRFAQSLRRDGIYFTGEKIVRRLNAKINKGKT